MAKAREIADSWRALAKDGIDPRKQDGQFVASKLTYGALVDRFIENYAKPRQRTWDQTERVLKNNCAIFLNRRMAHRQDKETRGARPAAIVHR